VNKFAIIYDFMSFAPAWALTELTGDLPQFWAAKPQMICERHHPSSLKIQSPRLSELRFEPRGVQEDCSFGQEEGIDIKFHL
jgi:hypothetical protein